MRALVVTVDFQKAFDSVNHLFLITAVKKFGFGETFIRCIQILLINQKSCIINGGTTTKYFKLQKVTDKEAQFLLIYLFLFLKLSLFSLKKIKILTTSIFLTIYSSFQFMPMIQLFF